MEVTSKVLLVNACLRKDNSRTLKLVEGFLKEARRKTQYQIIERNITDLKAKPLTSKGFNLDGTQKEIDASLAKEFALADYIVIGAPFYEFSFPSVLSIYIENISIPGITFKYVGENSVGLCKAMSLTYIYTAGGYLKEEDKIGEHLLKRLSSFYGIKEFHSLSATGLDIAGNDVDKIIKEALLEAKEKGSLQI